MFKPARKVYEWASEKAHSPNAPLWLGVIFIFEIVLFLPLDALLMLFCVQNPERRFIYALMATLSSLLIALIGYGVGYLLWDSVGAYITQHIISADFFERLVAHYNAHESVAVFVGSLLPIPFKAVTLSAGFCQLSLPAFIGSVLLARALRFFLIAEMMNQWGAPIKAFVDRHFNRLVVAVGAKAALTFTFFWILGS